jgi:hypothetical protein
MTLVLTWSMEKEDARSIVTGEAVAKRHLKKDEAG